MASAIISEIRSFLNLPQRSAGYFPIEQNCPTQGIDLGLARVREKNRPLMADQESIREFQEKQTVHALMRHRAGSHLPVRMSVVVIFITTITLEGAHHEIRENPS